MPPWPRARSSRPLALACGAGLLEEFQQQENEACSHRERHSRILDQDETAGEESAGLPELQNILEECAAPSHRAQSAEHQHERSGSLQHVQEPRAHQAAPEPIALSQVEQQRARRDDGTALEAAAGSQLRMQYHVNAKRRDEWQEETTGQCDGLAAFADGPVASLGCPIAQALAA